MPSNVNEHSKKHHHFPSLQATSGSEVAGGQVAVLVQMALEQQGLQGGWHQSRARLADEAGDAHFRHWHGEQIGCWMYHITLWLVMELIPPEMEGRFAVTYFPTDGPTNLDAILYSIADAANVEGDIAMLDEEDASLAGQLLEEVLQGVGPADYTAGDGLQFMDKGLE